MNDQTDFSALDRQFGAFLQRLARGGAAEVRLAAMCASRGRSEGHICVPLAEIATLEGAPTATKLQKSLRSSGVVGAAGDFTPLVLDKKNRLYLRRYFEYEQQLAQAILRRATGHSLARASDETDLQKVAAARAVANNFTVITGGPGTGKTRTVMAILNLLYKQPDGEKLRIALAAPTGKAAARLTESVRGSTKL